MTDQTPAEPLTEAGRRYVESFDRAHRHTDYFLMGEPSIQDEARLAVLAIEQEAALRATDRPEVGEAELAGLRTAIRRRLETVPVWTHRPDPEAAAGSESAKRFYTIRPHEVDEAIDAAFSERTYGSRGEVIYDPALRATAHRPDVGELREALWEASIHLGDHSCAEYKNDHTGLGLRLQTLATADKATREPAEDVVGRNTALAALLRAAEGQRGRKLSQVDIAEVMTGVPAALRQPAPDDALRTALKAGRILLNAKSGPYNYASQPQLKAIEQARATWDAYWSAPEPPEAGR